MRKIEEDMCCAVDSRRNWRRSNTRVECEDGWIRVYLFGNLIMEESPNGVRHYSTAGWDTPTTRSRLRALGCDAWHYRGELYCDGQLWNGRDW